MTEPSSPERGVTFDITSIAEGMRSDAAYVRGGHTARTIVREPDLRIVVVAMRAESVIKEHKADDTASIQTISGNIQLRLPDRVVELPMGCLLVLERGLVHNVEALVESTFMLTLGRTKA
jgi:quercetin dioxygenase-like cupin family protein